SFNGVSKSDADKLREKINLVTGKIITENLVQSTQNEVKKHYVDKGFLNVDVKIDVQDEKGMVNSQLIVINVKKGKRVKIRNINFEGVTQIDEKKLKRKMKDTKERNFFRFFSSSKFIEDNYETDKHSIIAQYTQ